MSSKHKTSLVVFIIMLCSLVVFFQNCAQEETGDLGSIIDPPDGGGGPTCAVNCTAGSSVSYSASDGFLYINNLGFDGISCAEGGPGGCSSPFSDYIQPNINPESCPTVGWRFIGCDPNWVFDGARWRTPGTYLNSLIGNTTFTAYSKKQSESGTKVASISCNSSGVCTITPLN